MDWFLYHNRLRHERVKTNLSFSLSRGLLELKSSLLKFNCLPKFCVIREIFYIWVLKVIGLDLLKLTFLLLLFDSLIRITFKSILMEIFILCNFIWPTTIRLRRTESRTKNICF